MQNAIVCGQSFILHSAILTETGGGVRSLFQSYVGMDYSAGMKVSMMPFTVPSSISSFSAALKSS